MNATYEGWSQRSEEGIGSLETVDAGSCEPDVGAGTQTLRAVQALKPCSLFHSSAPTFLVFLSLRASLFLSTKFHPLGSESMELP